MAHAPSGTLACPSKRDSCVKRASANVAVRVKARPEAHCFQESGAPIKGRVRLDIKLGSKIKIREVKSHHNDDDCHKSCEFEFELPWTCDADVVTGHCDDSHGNVRVKLAVPVKTDCKVVNVCEDKSDRNDQSSRSNKHLPRESNSKSGSRHHGIPIQRQKSAPMKVPAKKQ